MLASPRLQRGCAGEKEIGQHSPKLSKGWYLHHCPTTETPMCEIPPPLSNSWGKVLVNTQKWPPSSLQYISSLIFSQIQISMLFLIDKKKVMTNSQTLNHEDGEKANMILLKKLIIYEKDPRFSLQKSTVLFISTPVRLMCLLYSRWPWDSEEMSCEIRKYFILTSALPVRKVAVWVLLWKFFQSAKLEKRE